MEPYLAEMIPIDGSPGGIYLERRGIPIECATEAGVLFAPDHYGRAAVIWPIRDAEYHIVAIGGRYLDDRKPKARTRGKLALGIFPCLDALNSTPVIIVEGPCDALSLAACRIPSLALHGTSWPQWLPNALRGKQVVVALDGDAAGQAAADALLQCLRPVTTHVERWRPSDGKDWNDVLLRHGVEAFHTEIVRRLAEIPDSPPNGSTS